MEYTCNLCGMKKNEVIEKSQDHDWQLYNVKSAYCNSTGAEYYRCSICQEEKTVELPINPGRHRSTSYRNMNEYIAATCVDNGYEGNWYCSGCDTKVRDGAIIPATGKHTYKYSEYENGNCITAGWFVYNCSVCGAEKKESGSISSDIHTGNTNIINIKEATCGEAGYSGDTVCTDCGVVIEKGSSVPASGKHTYGTASETKPATCVTEGEQESVCSVCGDIKKEPIPVNADNHEGEEKLVNEKAATCTEDGYTGDTVCSKCNAVLRKGTTIESLGTEHSWNESAAGSQAQIYEYWDGIWNAVLVPAITTSTCSYCGEIKKEVNKKIELEAASDDGTNEIFLDDILDFAEENNCSTLGEVFEAGLMNDLGLKAYAIVDKMVNMHDRDGFSSITRYPVDASISLSETSKAITIEELEKAFTDNPNGRVQFSINSIANGKPVTWDDTYSDYYYFGRYEVKYDLDIDIYGKSDEISNGETAFYIIDHEHDWKEECEKHTETKDGKIIKTCQVEGCNVVKYEVMPAGHVNSSGNYTYTSYCVQDDNGAYLATDGKRYNIKLGKIKYTCSLCGDEISEDDYIHGYVYQEYNSYPKIAELIKNGNVTLGDIGIGDIPIHVEASFSLGSYDSDTSITFDILGSLTYNAEYSDYPADTTLESLLGKDTDLCIGIGYTVTPKVVAGDPVVLYDTSYDVLSDDVYVGAIMNERMWHEYHISDDYSYDGDKWEIIEEFDPYCDEDGEWNCGGVKKKCKICDMEDIDYKNIPTYMHCGNNSNTTTMVIDGVSYFAVDAGAIFLNYQLGVARVSSVNFAKFFTVYYSPDGTYSADSEKCVRVEGKIEAPESYTSIEGNDIYFQYMEDNSRIIIPVKFTPNSTDFQAFETSIVVYIGENPYNHPVASTLTENYEQETTAVAAYSNDESAVEQASQPARKEETTTSSQVIRETEAKQQEETTTASQIVKETETTQQEETTTVSQTIQETEAQQQEETTTASQAIQETEAQQQEETTTASRVIQETEPIQQEEESVASQLVQETEPIQSEEVAAVSQEIQETDANQN